MFEKRLEVENEQLELTLRNFEVLSMHDVGSYAAGPGINRFLESEPDATTFELDPVIDHFGLPRKFDSLVNEGPVA